MGRLPTVQDFGPRPVARPNRGIAQAGNVNAVGDATQALGRGVTDIGNAVFEREATAAATERDTYVSDQLRELLYNPETGFAATQGKGAVDRRGDVMGQIDQLRDSAMEGLNETAKRKLDASIQRRLDSARQSVEIHTLGERDRWLDGASAARVESALQDSLANPAATAESLSIIESETRAKGLREGWGAERTAVELEAAKSGVFVSQIERIAATDPIAAMEYMRNNQGSMRPSDLAAIEAKLQPEVKSAVGRSIARQVFAGTGSGAAVSMDTRAVNRPSSDITNISLDFNASKDGGARGTEVIIPDNASPELRAAAEDFNNRIVAFAAKHGFEHPNRGVKTRTENGRGVANTVHVEPFFNDNVAFQEAIAENFGEFSEIYEASFGHLQGARIIPPHGVGADKGAASEVFGSETEFGREVARRIITGRGEPATAIMGYRQLVDIQDPDERKAALAEYQLLMNVAEGQAAAEQAAARDQAFQYIENGNMIDDLPGSIRRSLGEDSMSALRTYQGKVLSGKAIETDDRAYYELRQMQAVDPDAFRSLDLLTYRDKLDDGDWQKFVDAQTTPPAKGSLSSASTLMGIASRQLGAAGIEDEETTAALQSTLLRWQDEFVSQNNRPPTQTEIDAQIGQQLLPVLIDGPGMFGASDRQETTLIQLQELDLSERQLAETSIRVLDTDIPPAVINEQIIALQSAGEEVTPYALTQRILGILDAAGIR